MTNNEEPMITAAGGWCVPTDQLYEIMSQEYIDAHNASLREIMNRTPEEWAAIAAEQKAEAETKLRVAEARWNAVHFELSKLTVKPHGSALLRIVERHRPEIYCDRDLRCSHTHEGGYEWEPSGWPCEDFSDAAGAVGL